MSYKWVRFIFKLLPSNNRLERIWKIAQVDFQSRYYNDRLGLLWALIKPVFEAILYFVAFKYLLGVEKDDFAIFLFGGIVTWIVFSEGTARSINLLKAKDYLINNIQFNHVDLYFSHVLSVIFGFLFNFIAFLVLAWMLGHSISLLYFFLPIIFINIFLMVLGFAFFLSTVQPFLKDITHLWDMILLAGFWLSGIFFEPNIIPDNIMPLTFVNPFIGIIANVRGIVLDSYEFRPEWLIINISVSIVFCLLGYLVYTCKKGMAIEKL